MIGGVYVDAKSPWVRIECEWRSTNRDIPNDILITPGKYLAGAYPALMWINEVQESIKTITKKTQIVYEQMVRNASRQFGQLISYMIEAEGSYRKVFKKLARPGIPKRLIIPDWRDAKNAIHDNSINFEYEYKTYDDVLDMKHALTSLVSRWKAKVQSNEALKALENFFYECNTLFRKT